jgi:hypothetical protein
MSLAPALKRIRYGCAKKVWDAKVNNNLAAPLQALGCLVYKAMLDHLSVRCLTDSTSDRLPPSLYRVYRRPGSAAMSR